MEPRKEGVGMTPRQEDVRVGMEVETVVGIGLQSQQTRGIVIELVVTANECFAVTQVGDRRGRTNMFRTRLMHRCKFDTVHADLPVCPLAKLTCHSPCDIFALSYGAGFAYPRVIELPDA